MTDCSSNKAMGENCCQYNDTPTVNYLQSYRKDGERYTPTFSDKVDHEKCTGCGKCISVCGQGVYILVEVNGKKKADNINANRCLGDCHCHKVCSVNALICKPKIISNKKGISE